MGVLEGRKSSGSPADWSGYGGDMRHTDTETLTLNDEITIHGLFKGSATNLGPGGGGRTA
jgi:hypothetical protein